MSRYYFIYRTTNNINKKIYIGVHSTDNLEDGYLGSGKLLNLAVKKHGLENFSREILEFFNNKEEMYAKEKILVDKDFISRKDTYNLCEGGMGAVSSSLENLVLIYGKKKGLKIYKSINKKKARPGNLNGMYGKTHTNEVKAAQGKRAKERFTGKTYEELLGEEKAKKLRNLRSISMKKIRKEKSIEGENNPNYHKVIFTVINIETKEKFKGARYEIGKYTKIEGSMLTDITKHKKIRKKWKLI